MTRATNAFRAVVAILGLIPVAAGLDGALQGATMTGAAGPTDPALDSHVRYLSGLLLAIGVAFWSTLGDPARHTARFRLLTAIVFTGGLARLLGTLLAGAPPPAMLAGLAMELVVTPALCLWQAGLARRGTAPTGC